MITTASTLTAGTIFTTEDGDTVTVLERDFRLRGTVHVVTSVGDLYLLPSSLITVR